MSKVLAFLDARGQTIYVDHSVHQRKRVFITLHDTAHGFLPWQRDTYAILEEDESTLDPEIRDLFERQANVFASEVLFQLDAFQEHAADHPFSIRTPVQLAKRFGSSCYAAARRYVATNQRACALIVLNMPIYEVGAGYTVTVRRYLQSLKFTERFGQLHLPACYGPGHPFTSRFPGRSHFRDRFFCHLTNRNNESDPCVGEAFNSGYEIFILLYPAKELKPTSAPIHS